ncbi:MAG TPA: BlaI/MecI/CopY family transcriptional regulator [Tepidisphaeraceae bacterium]|nr:BlaI/MecI/CopY family transcriptional regulator [Tepidisphaeraceae bacterium]
MPDIPAISESEWDVMNVLWEADGPLTAEQVVAAVAGVRDWSPRTVKTLLNRLINKRALAFEQQGKRYLYRPNISREQCVRHESRSFLSRVFNGAAGPLLVHFVKQARLSPQEVEELKRLLDQKGK